MLISTYPLITENLKVMGAINHSQHMGLLSNGYDTSLARMRSEFDSRQVHSFISVIVSYFIFKYTNPSKDLQEEKQVK